MKIAFLIIIPILFLAITTAIIKCLANLVDIQFLKIPQYLKIGLYIITLGVIIMLLCLLYVISALCYTIYHTP